MSIPLTYPGVYIEEVPSGVRTIVGVPTSVAAFVGRAPRGPIDEPTTIFNFGDFTRLFGGLSVDYPLTYAVRSFFANGGGQAVVVRAFKEDTTPSLATFTIVAGTGSLALTAAEPGTWARSLQVQADVNGIPTGDELAESLGLDDNTQLFNLSVLLESGVVETLRNLTFADSPRRVDRVLASESSYLRAVSLPPADTLGTAVATTLTNPDADTGSDGQPLTLADDYFGTAKAGVNALDKTDIFNLLCLPPDTQGGDLPAGAADSAAAYCLKRRAMFIVDPPAAWNGAPLDNIALTDVGISGPAARNAAVFFPRLNQANPLRAGLVETFVPCGAVAGIYAATDATRGIWKAPAGVDAGVAGVDSLSRLLTDEENGLLNPLGINCLRTFPIIGTVVWGARTTRGADQLGDEYKYVPVRRTALFIEESLYRGTKWVVFEPNDERLWSQIRLNVGTFMHDLFRQGAFQGQSAREAYFVKCDKETTTQSDINRGIVNILVGFAPLKPAEFVVIKLQQMAGQVSA